MKKKYCISLRITITKNPEIVEGLKRLKKETGDSKNQIIINVLEKYFKKKRLIVKDYIDKIQSWNNNDKWKAIWRKAIFTFYILLFGGIISIIGLLNFTNIDPISFSLVLTSILCYFFIFLFLCYLFILDLYYQLKFNVKDPKIFAKRINRSLKDPLIVIPNDLIIRATNFGNIYERNKAAIKERRNYEIKLPENCISITNKKFLAIIEL